MIAGVAVHHYNQEIVVNTITVSADEIVREYFEALERSDVEGTVSLFAADGYFMIDEVPTAHGTAQIRAALEETLRVLNVSCVYEIDRVTEVGELAIVEAHSTDTVTMLASNSKTLIEFRELFILRRAGNGWQITDYIFNRPVAVTGAP